MLTPLKTVRKELSDALNALFHPALKQGDFSGVKHGQEIRGSTPCSKKSNELARPRFKLLQSQQQRLSCMIQSALVQYFNRALRQHKGFRARDPLLVFLFCFTLALGSALQKCP